MRTSHCAFCVMRPRLEVRLRNSAVDSSGSSPARLLGAHRAEEQREDERTRGEQAQHEPEVVVGREDAGHDQDEAGGREHGAAGVERLRGIGRQRVASVRLSQTIRAMIKAWKTKAQRQLSAEVMRPPISGPAAAPIPPAALMAPNARAREVTVGEQQRGQDVDGRDEQRRADALEDRVAEDEHAETGGDRAEQRTDAVQHESDR